MAEATEKKLNPLLLIYERLCGDLQFWKTPDGKLYADYVKANKRHTIPLEGMGNFIRSYAEANFNLKVLGAKGVADVEKSLQARCSAEGVVRPVHIRVASIGGKTYYDLGTDDNTCVCISAEGWHLEPNPPVKFYRPSGQHAQVTPAAGGNIDLLRKYVRFENDSDFYLYVGWLLSIFNPVKEYPILILNGAQGTAKSTITLLSKLLLDPHEYTSFSEPKDIRDLVAYARNTFVISMDNVSYLPNWLSDSMCRLTHGTAALGGRELYKDHDMAAFAAARAIVLNGIPEFVERNDLADRVIQLHLKPIAPEERRKGSSILQEFKVDLPSILGALLDLAVAAFNRQHANLDNLSLPRLADWGEFVGGALGYHRVLLPYNTNKETAEQAIAENNSVAVALINLLLEKENFEGTMHELMSSLIMHKPIGDQNWPKDIRGLRSELRRLEPSLKNRGMVIKKHGLSNGSRRQIFQFLLPKNEVTVSASYGKNSYN